MTPSPEVPKGFPWKDAFGIGFPVKGERKFPFRGRSACLLRFAESRKAGPAGRDEVIFIPLYLQEYLLEVGKGKEGE